MMRTHLTSTLETAVIGSTVELCGWVAKRRDHGGVVFIDLRDAGGVVQVVVDPSKVVGVDPHLIRSEFVLRVVGVVKDRPEGTIKSDTANGAIEVAVDSVEILAACDALPIPVDEEVAADESLRLKYRYLDLRGRRLQGNLRLRARVNHLLRQAFDEREFVEVETPLLIASTPEGARDFVVPSRLTPGSFYALPQSPQLFKQLLMVGGLDRYFQIARCLRDEDPRADRQFEFTQLDMEMSFVDSDDVMDLVGEIVASVIRDVTQESADNPGRMTWADAMATYGTEKPDLRFDLPISDVTSVFSATEFRAFQADSVGALRIPESGELARARLDSLIERAQSLGAPGLVWIRVREGSLIDSPVAKFLSEEEKSALLAKTNAQPGDLILLAAGSLAMTSEVLGVIRKEFCVVTKDLGLQTIWVTDFPLFEGLDDQGNPISSHHPFTAPHPDDLDLFMHAEGEDLLSVRSQAYDLVVNGWELGSGSVRIHSREIQERVFSLLGISPELAHARFGFLLEAFRYGAPPHAGFAFGIDRLVALLAGEDNIREVIAFPKTQSGADPLTNAPSLLEGSQLKSLGLSLAAKKKESRP